MKTSQIKVNGIYRSARQDKFRLVVGIFNGNVLYAECGYDERNQIKPLWVGGVPCHRAHQLWKNLKKELPHSGGFSITWCFQHHLISLKSFARWAFDLVDVRANPNQRFLMACRALVAAHGRSVVMGGIPYQEEQYVAMQLHRSHQEDILVFVDDTISIALSTADGSMWVQRNQNKNPVICLNEFGISYRFHGEWSHMENHVLNKLPEGSLQVLMEDPGNFSREVVSRS